MPRHRTRQDATHLLSAERETQTGEDDYGAPTYGTETVLEDEPVEFDAGGMSYVRGSTGERVTQAPTVSGRGALARLLEPGDTVTLDPLDPDDQTTTSLEVIRIVSEYTGWARSGSVVIELETV